jgi:RNA polymerase sigma-70 factor (ECF subfamily)
VLAAMSWGDEVAAAPGLDVAEAYRSHGAFVANVIQGLTGRGPHVEELLHEVFIVAHKKRGSYDGRAAVRTWLYGIARHLSLRHNRSKRRFFGWLDRARLEPEVVPSSAEAQLAEAERVVFFHQALATLPIELREVFVLYELEEQEGAAIAELLGLPIGTVWTRLRTARQRFTQVVERRRKKEDR